MKIKRSRVTASGKREVVVEMDSLDGKLVEVSEWSFYRLGGQVEDIVPGHVLTEAGRVHWCPISQDWVTL